MRLEVNGSVSSSKPTKHIKWRYFSIRDKIANRDLKIRYCPTETMWADVLTKPKQGGPFRLDRSHLMNIPIDYNDNVEHTNAHPLLLPKDKCPAPSSKLMNNWLHITPIIHSRSVLGNTSPGHRIPAPGTQPSHVTLPVTPILEPPRKTLSRADRTRASATTN